MRPIVQPRKNLTQPKRL